MSLACPNAPVGQPRRSLPGGWRVTWFCLCPGAEFAKGKPKKACRVRISVALCLPDEASVLVASCLGGRKTTKNVPAVAGPPNLNSTP
jgi:hypothetical protein